MNVIKRPTNIGSPAARMAPVAPARECDGAFGASVTDFVLMLCMSSEKSPLDTFWPRDRATLLVRIMAGGPLLAPAVEELAALPSGAIERVVAEPVLLDFQRMLGQNPSQDAEEQEFIMAMHKTWKEGKTQARAEARANAVLTVLRVRGIAVPDAVRQQILAQQDLQRLEQWLERPSSPRRSGT